MEIKLVLFVSLKLNVALIARKKDSFIVNLFVNYFGSVLPSLKSELIEHDFLFTLYNRNNLSSNYSICDWDLFRKTVL